MKKDQLNEGLDRAFFTEDLSRRHTSEYAERI